MPWGFASGTHEKIELGSGLGSRRAPWRNGRSNDAGSAALTSAPWLKRGRFISGQATWLDGARAVRAPAEKAAGHTSGQDGALPNRVHDAKV